MRSSKVQTLIKALVLMMLFSSIVISQENSRTCGLTLKICLVKQTDNKPSTQYFSTGSNTAFGFYQLSGNDPERIYRSIYEVNLPGDLPAGAFVTQVEFVYKNSGNYSNEVFALYNIPISSYDNTLDNQKKWEITESGSFIHEYGVCGYSELTVGAFPLQEIINDALKVGRTKLYLGFRAYPESGPYNTLVNNFASVALKFTYAIIVSHTVKNSNGLGKINVSTYNGDFFEVNSGDTLRLPVGTAVRIRAKEEQFDGTYNWVWNQDQNTLDATKSIWQKKYNDIYTPLSGIEYAYTANANEIFATFTAQLKRKFLINRIDKTEFDGSSQTNDVTRVVELNSVNIPYPETLTKTTGTYSFAGWEDGGGSLKTPTDNTTYTALYKMPQKSNTQTAFSNSSQRKFIRTPNDGYYHMVYESMGKIWYERSSDGVNWTLGNNGKPLNTDYVFGPGGVVTGTGSYTTAKHPALDYYQDKILVVWQEQSGNNYVVRLAFLTNGQPKDANDIPFTSYGLYTEDIYPEIAAKDNGFAVIAIRRNDNFFKGLEIHYVTLVNAGLGMASEHCSGTIPGTDQNTGSFTLATDRNYTDKYHIAWQQILSSAASSMQYAKFNFSWLPNELPPDGYYEMNIVKSVNVSNSTSYTRSYSPSMIGVSDGTARLAFKGFRQYYYGGGGSYSISSVCPDNLSWIPYLRKYSGEVFSPQISLGSDTYFVGWTEPGGGIYKTIATDASTLRDMEAVLNSSGRDIQINNGGTKSQQFSIGFNSESTSLPYIFKPSDAIGTIVANKKLPISKGRGIFLTKGESQMYFILGNVSSGGVNISFPEAKDTVRLDGNLKKVNSFLLTEPFSLKDNSAVSFALMYGTKDSSTSKSSIKEGQFATFKVELIDDASGRVIGNYLDERMDKDNIFSLKESVYKVNSDGIGSKLVRLRVSVDENMKSQYTISDMIMGEGLPLSKSLKEKEMGLNGSLEVKEYSLSQNYPNPFNPTTLISYALPRAGKVTLRVYDILGKEVATLVNGYMEMGKYSVEFNASNLPSGIYIYEIRANDFVKSGKMMLLK